MSLEKLSKFDYTMTGAEYLQGVTDLGLDRNTAISTYNKLLRASYGQRVSGRRRAGCGATLVGLFGSMDNDDFGRVSAADLETGDRYQFMNTLGAWAIARHQLEKPARSHIIVNGFGEKSADILKEASELVFAREGCEVLDLAGVSLNEVEEYFGEKIPII